MESDEESIVYSPEEMTQALNALLTAIEVLAGLASRLTDRVVRIEEFLAELSAGTDEQ